MSEDDAPRRARLPDVALPRADGGDPMPLRLARTATVLVLVEAPLGADDAARLRTLDLVRGELAGWDGRVLVVAPAALDEAPPASFPLLVDAEGIVARVAGAAVPATVVIDQWGEVHAAAPALPAEELVALARWLSIRCAG